MKKILYLFILILVVILPINVAAKDLKNQCDYKDENLDARLKIYADDNNEISTELILYKFGSEEWEEGKTGTGFLWTSTIKAENYSSAYSINGATISAYRSSKNYACPRYILLEDDEYFNAYVSDDSRELSEFADKAFKTDRKYIGSIEQQINSKVCRYMHDTDGTTRVEITVENDKVSKVSSFYQGKIVTANHNFEANDFVPKCKEKIYYFYGGGNEILLSSEYSASTISVLNLLGNEGGGSYDEENEDDYFEEEEDDDVITPGTKIEFTEGCNVISNDLKNWLIQLLDFVKIAGLTLTLILGMFDFFKGVSSGKPDEMKKVWKSFSRRLIAVVLLFLLPLIIEFLFGLINISGIDSSNPLCGIK